MHPLAWQLRESKKNRVWEKGVLDEALAVETLKGIPFSSASKTGPTWIMRLAETPVVTLLFRTVEHSGRRFGKRTWEHKGRATNVRKVGFGERGLWKRGLIRKAHFLEILVNLEGHEKRERDRKKGKKTCV